MKRSTKVQKNSPDFWPSNHIHLLFNRFPVVALNGGGYGIFINIKALNRPQLCFAQEANFSTFIFMQFIVKTFTQYSFKYSWWIWRWRWLQWPTTPANGLGCSVLMSLRLAPIAPAALLRLKWERYHKPIKHAQNGSKWLKMGVKNNHLVTYQMVT